MHDYSIDKHPKEKILFALAFLAIIATPFINQALSQVQENLGGWTLPLTGLSVFMVFGTIFWFFNQFLWKCKHVRKLLLMPDLNGKWECSGITLIKAGEETNYAWKAEINITQSWSKIIIRLKTKESVSRSTSASITRLEGQGFKILYHYQNDPTAIVDTLNKHDGAAEIIFNQDCTEGEGHYFTDQHRSTVGSLTLRKIK
ncbi:MAG: hypothetical protein ACRBDI_10645 [Alphaproteobacteria bacterium]